MSFMSPSDESPPDLVEFESLERRLPSSGYNSNQKNTIDQPTYSTMRDNTFSDDSHQSVSTESSILLAASLQALATHCAHLQFRLHQVLEAPTAHRDKLLSELAEFASRPIDHLGGIAPTSNLIDYSDGTTTSSSTVPPTSIVPTRTLEHLKTQVADLERFVTYLQQNEANISGDPASAGKRTVPPTFTKGVLKKELSGREPEPLALRSVDNDESDDDSKSVPLHRRLWQALACGRSMQRVRQDDSDESDGEERSRVVQSQPLLGRERSSSIACDEDTESVVVLLETTVRAFLESPESEIESRVEALAYSLAVVITHGIRKDRLAKLQKTSSPGQAAAVRQSILPVAALCWNFLKFLYDSQGGPPSTEANAARLRATFDVPEPSFNGNVRNQTSAADIITLLLGAINRVTVEEDDETAPSPRRKSLPSVSDNIVSAGIHSWSRFVRVGLTRPSQSENKNGASGYPLVVWIRAIIACHRFLKVTHFSSAPLRSTPERINQVISLLDGPPESTNQNNRHRQSEMKGRRKLSTTNSNVMISATRSHVPEDIIIPGV